MSNGYSERTYYKETRIDIPKEYVIATLQKEFPHLLEIQRILNEIKYGTVTVDITVRNSVAEKMMFYNERRSWLKDQPILIENLEVSIEPVDSKQQ